MVEQHQTRPCNTKVFMDEARCGLDIVFWFYTSCSAWLATTSTISCCTSYCKVTLLRSYINTFIFFFFKSTITWQLDWEKLRSVQTLNGYLISTYLYCTFSILLYYCYANVIQKQWILVYAKTALITLLITSICTVK